MIQKRFETIMSSPHIGLSQNWKRFEEKNRRSIQTKDSSENKVWDGRNKTLKLLVQKGKGNILTTSWDRLEQHSREFSGVDNGEMEEKIGKSM
jgi:hypothetical protein